MFGGKLGIWTPTSRCAAGFQRRTRPARTRLGLDEERLSRRARPRRAPRDKLVFVNFTGYACTNCHWMKANMFTRPEIAGALRNFVLVELYTDGTDDASRVISSSNKRSSTPSPFRYYAIIDPDENVIASFPGLTRDPAEYLAFLQKTPAEKSAQGDLAALPTTTLDGGSLDTAGLQGRWSS